MTPKFGARAVEPWTCTLPKLVRCNAERFGRAPGIREKDRGIWRTYSWQAYYDNVHDMALGLAACGFRRGDKLSVVGDNRPCLYWAQLAAQALGGIAVPVYQDAIASELVYVLDHAEVSVVVAEDQEQVDKVLSLKERLPQLRSIIFSDPRGLGRYQDPMLQPLAQMQAAGREFGRLHPGYFEHELDTGRGDDAAIIAYTSGTTGRPKGAMLSHRNLIATAENYASAERIRRGDNCLAYLPMAWVGDLMFSLAIALVTAVTVNCPEGPETVQRDLRELGPHAFFAPPRIWESLLTQMQVKAADASWLKRRAYEFFRRAAEQRELLRADGRKISLARDLVHRLGEILIYGPVRDQLGLRNTRWCLSGGAPLGPTPSGSSGHSASISSRSTARPRPALSSRSSATDTRIRTRSDNRRRAGKSASMSTARSTCADRACFSATTNRRTLRARR